MLLSRLIAAQRSLGDVVRGRFCLVDVDQVCSVGSHHLEHFPRDFQKIVRPVYDSVIQSSRFKWAQFERANFLRVLGEHSSHDFPRHRNFERVAAPLCEFIVRCSHCHRRQSFNHADQGDFLRVCQRLVSVNFRLFAVFVRQGHFNPRANCLWRHLALFGN